MRSREAAVAAANGARGLDAGDRQVALRTCERLEIGQREPEAMQLLLAVGDSYRVER